MPPRRRRWEIAAGRDTGFCYNNSKMKKVTNHFLMANSGTGGSLFDNSMIYICRHDDAGAFGIIINKPSRMPVAELLKKPARNAAAGSHMIMHGGPVKRDQVFILHSPPSEYDVTIKVGEEIGVTLSKDILEAIEEKRAPEKMLFACGYAGWESGQLEEEISDNAWIVLPAATDIIFDLPPAKRLAEATRRFGFEVGDLSSITGRA